MFGLSFRISITPAMSMHPVPTSIVEKPQPKIVPRFGIHSSPRSFQWMW